MALADLSNTIYGFFFVTVAVLAGLGVLAKHAIHNLIEVHMSEIRDELKRLDRIEYALYNDGKTGLINKVDALMENQQMIKTDIEVMKAVYESGK